MSGQTFDFARHQRQARRRTWLLVALFLVMTTVIAVAAGAVAGWIMGVPQADFVEAAPDGTPPELPAEEEAPGVLEQLDVEVMAMVTLGVAGVILLVAGIRGWMLGADGAKVAQALGGVEVTEDTRNPQQRRLYNIVQEMSIASRLPMPRVYVIRHEQGINAFAAGLTPDRAAVAVTHGALSTLNREELKAVMAHEFAHVANGDMRMNLRLMAMIFGLVALFVAGRMAIRFAFLSGGGQRDQRAVMAAFAVGGTLIVLGGLGVLFGRMLQAAISRKREYLADATAAEYTRNPGALANALKKIGALQRADVETFQNAHGEEVRHMLFADAVAKRMAGVLATHPPLMERIRALEPQFDPAHDPMWNASQKELIRKARRDESGTTAA